MTEQRPLLEVTDLVKHYPVRGGVLRRQVGTVHAVDGVSFALGAGETLGLVGESGCGKSTVARTVLRLVEPTSGAIRLDGEDIAPLSKSALRPYRRSMQIVFQDPFASLNPRMTAGDIVGEPLTVHGLARGVKKQDRVAELFQQVGLRADQMKNFPHQFSGGQRQRICIARALSLGPRLIVCDEPVSALDVSIQAQVIALDLSGVRVSAGAACSSGKVARSVTALRRPTSPPKLTSDQLRRDIGGPPQPSTP